MNAIFVALVSTLVAFLLGRLVLYKYVRSLNIKDQSFRFHELRDRLQLLAIDGKIEKTSRTYEFLQFTINLSIKNAGSMKLSELLNLAKAINVKMNVPRTDEIFADIRRHDQEVQQLSADMFASLARMLISNDHLIFLLAKIMEFSTDIVKGVARKAVKNMLRALMPEHSEAVRAVLNYRDWGNSLNLQLHTGG
jgi:hypothetical protein